MERIHYTEDSRAEDLVDPSIHLELDDLPKSVQPGAKKFAAKVLRAKKIPAPIKPPNLDGISEKAFYRVGGGKTKLGKVKQSQIFMVKPYAEDFQGWDCQYYPISGFSEMATQGIMHAAGLGEQAMKVHTFMSPAGSPLLGIEWRPGFRTVENVSDYARYVSIPGSVATHLNKLGVIDYLTNHQDRHAGNLMVRLQEGKIHGILSIDNGRSFQYRKGLRFADNHRKIEHPMFHLGSPGIRQLLGQTRVDGGDLTQFLTPSRFTGIIKWWRGRQGAITSAFEHHLETIKDEKVRYWIDSNFRERVRVMNDIADYWEASGQTSQEIRDIDPQHWGTELGVLAKQFALRVGYNEHGENFRAGDGDEVEETPCSYGDPHNNRWCSECQTHHTN